jgi:hypothetical protein
MVVCAARRHALPDNPIRRPGFRRGEHVHFNAQARA